ncbi:MAG: Unknown protein [uncultured Sulfurovum sp.]|uniref:Uncharacterized protein n=1 Tax=uncultured Sulfurovum sp. TaxID=269237 RepID=A0A6S6S551_9BACT|nr:MAG: Unknown protein [uncultured Sulfurovum sp.]
MKRFIQLMSTVLVLGAMATASTNVGGNPEVSVKKNNPTTVFTQCDPLERFLGACRSSENSLTDR